MVSGALIFNNLRATVRKFESAFLSTVFGRPFPPPALCVNDLTLPPSSATPEKYSLKDILGDGFLYAVPKSRRTIEKRMKRKFGWPHQIYKILLPKKHLKVCNVCGLDYEPPCLCAHCYKRVKLETEEMQKQIETELGLNPIEQDVVVLYEGEKLEEPEEFWKGKRIIEMKKPRPSWYSKNLLQKTTQQPATTKEVKPTDLA